MSEWSLPPRPPAESEAIMIEPVMPSDANVVGTAFGGRVMQWIDLCGSIAAQRHCRRPVVTASMDEVHFHSPIRIGHWAVLKGRVTAAFRSSMEIDVTVHTEDPLTGDRKLCTSALMTFVALDARGKSVAVPPLELQSDDERRLEREAHARRDARLARRAQRLT